VSGLLLLQAGQWGANPLTTLVMLSFLSLLPFLLMMSSSFVKFSVVFSILRSALGLQQVPPPAVTMGLALIMSVYVMSPVAAKVYDSAEPLFTQSTGQDIVSPGGAQTVLKLLERARDPVRDFLARNAHARERGLFHQMALRMGPPRWKESMKDDDLLVLVPAFTVSELKEAFMIGFLIFLPFLVIDLVIAAVLMSMGMMMVPPALVSLPFKLAFFVIADGWSLLAGALVRSYNP